jgi:hypothetical protein
MKLHSKQLGAIGVLRVAAHLMSQGLSIFAEMGDLSRVDLIVLFDNQPIKIQGEESQRRQDQRGFSEEWSGLSLSLQA